MSYSALPIECKKSIISYLFPFVNKEEEWKLFIDYYILAMDSHSISEIDEDSSAIIQNAHPLLIYKYKDIDDAKFIHRLNFEYDIKKFIKKHRISATHSASPCLICKEELPYNWPSIQEVRHLYAGVCSKECYFTYKTSPMWKSIKHTKYKCNGCQVAVFPPDVDSIQCEGVFCSHKCQAKYEHTQQINYYDIDQITF